MMKLGRYITACIIVFAVITLIILLGGNYIGLYLDYVSLLIIVLLSLAIQIGTFGWKDFWGAFALPFRKEKAEAAEYSKAEAILSSTKKQIYLASGIGFFIATIAIITFLNSETSADAGVNSAIALVVIFYGMLLNLMLVEPLRAWLERASKE